MSSVAVSEVTLSNGVQLSLEDVDRLVEVDCLGGLSNLISIQERRCARLHEDELLSGGYNPYVSKEVGILHSLYSTVLKLQTDKAIFDLLRRKQNGSVGELADVDESMRELAVEALGIIQSEG